MLRSVQQLYGNQLGASDGVIGDVKDFYFDDQNWAIRYLVVDTGSWLPGRQVLISPYSLGWIGQAEKVVHVNLTRKQIENSPSIELHQPVSRQYEEEYYRYYGWPYYWRGAGLWGLSSFPILELPPNPRSNEPVPAMGTQPEHPHAQLRSMQAVNGYRLHRGEKVIGYVCNFMMDAQSWVIGQLVIKTENRFSGAEVLIPMKNVVLIPTKNVERISYENATVFATLGSGTAGPRPAPNLAPAREAA